MNSFNHYSLGAVGEWMFRSILGIETDGAGFKKILMKPELGEGITWAKGHYDSIRGRIGSDWKIENSAFDWKITIPPNTTATVFVPAKDASSVTESCQSAAEAKGVKFLRMENDRGVFEVGSGNYEFHSRL
jgi:alpha-L-rhamnosidase